MDSITKISKALCVEWQNSTLRIASTPERANENINVNKYFHFHEWGSNQSHLQSNSFYLLDLLSHLMKITHFFCLNKI